MNLLVVLPVALAALSLWTVVLAVAGARSLESTGGLRRDTFVPSLLLAATVVGIGALASLTARAGRALRRKPSPTISMDAPWPGRWLLRHPWVSTGLLLLTVDATIVPLDMAGIVDVHAVPIGAALLGTGLWLVGTFGYALVRGWVLVLQLIWAGVRRSSFFAGLVVVGSLAISFGGGLLGRGFSSQAAALTPAEPREEIAECRNSATECTRRILQDAAHPKSRRAGPAFPTTTAGPAPTRPAPAPAAASPEPPPAFDECIRELHRLEAGTSLRDWGVAYARQKVLDQSTAEDIVHSTMLAVCTAADRLRDVRPYFTKSLQYAVYRERRNSRRWCPMVPDAQTWPAGCVARTIEEQAIRQELEDSAAAALCDLDVLDRWIIEARLWDELPYDQIARGWGITPESARQRYFRALAALRAFRPR